MVIVPDIVVMAVIGCDPLGLAVAVHQGLERLAEGILLERQVARHQAGKAGEHQRLHGDAVIAVRRLGGLAVTLDA